MRGAEEEEAGAEEKRLRAEAIWEGLGREEEEWEEEAGVEEIRLRAEEI